MQLCKMAELTSIKEEYEQFLLFIKQTSEYIRNELSSLVYPFYVHIYVLFLKNNKSLEGEKFLSSYIHIFRNSQGSSDVTKNLLELKDLPSLEEFRKHSYFKQFLESNYTVSLSEESISYLKEYFEKTECKNLFTIFRQCIFANRKSSYPVPEINIKDSSGIGITKFNEVLKKLKENLSPFTNIYKVVADGRNLCCVDINFENTQLICGYENRAIHFWNLTSNFLKVENCESNRFQYLSVAANSNEEYLANDGKKLSVPGSDKMLSGHTGAVYGLATCPNDNSLLVSCSQDGTVRTWNLTEFKTVAVYTGFFNPVWDVAVSPDGNCFASASKDAKLWSFEHQVPLQIFKGHLHDIDCVTFHPTAKFTIATAAADNKIKIWSTEQQHAVRTFHDNKVFQSSITFSPNGCQLASADANGSVKIFDVGSGRIMKEFQAHNSRILNISFNKQGTLLATGGFDKYLKVWDIQCTPTNIVPKTVISHFVGEVVQLVKFLKKDLLVSVI